MARDSAGLRLLAEQMIGYDALQWDQDEQHERANWARMGMAHEAGWVVDWVGPTANAGWTLSASSRLLSVVDDTLSDVARPDPSGARPFVGVNRRGEVLEVIRGAIYDDAGVQIIVPDDSVWRTLIARYATTQRAPGSIAVTTGSATIVGTGTQFTRYAAAADPGGPTKIRIAAADTVNGNDYIASFATITDDTHATLSSVVPGTTESGVRFRVRGDFYGAAPADPDIHRNVSVTWELVSRTTTRPVDGALIVMDCKSTAGVVTFIDRRRANIWRPFTGESVSYGMSLSGFYLPNTCTPNSNEVTFSYGGGSGSPYTPIALSLAPAASGSHLAGIAVDQPTGLLAAALYDNAGTRGIKVQEWSVLYSSMTSATSAGRWDDPNDGAAVDIATGAGLKDVALVTLPEGCGFTHLAYYVDSAGTILSKTSADNGATWVGPATVLAGADVLRISATLTRLQRIVLVFVSGTDPYARGMWSDDLGTSYDTDAGGGYDLTLSNDAQIRDMSVCEDDRGGLWVASGITLVASNNPIRLYRGDGEGNVLPDSLANAKVGPESSGSAGCSHVEMCALPNGHVAIMGEATDESSHAHAWLIVAANRKAVSVNVVANEVDTNGTGRHSPVGLAPLANGELAATWTRFENAALHKAQTLRYSPVAIHRANTLFGYAP